jgi:hypothetical protein
VPGDYEHSNFKNTRSCPSQGSPNTKLRFFFFAIVIKVQQFMETISLNKTASVISSGKYRYAHWGPKLLHNPSISRVNCCWSSPAESTLFSGPVGTHGDISVLSNTFTCFEMGPPLRREEGSEYYWSPPPPSTGGDSSGHSLANWPSPLHIHATCLCPSG